MSRVMVTGGSGFIGTHLVDRLLRDGHELVNIDLAAPNLATHQDYWRPCDIKDAGALAQAFAEFDPAHVIHLAAKANLKGTTVADFPDNVLGTRNVVECVNRAEPLRHFTHVSTQYVVRPGVWPRNDAFLFPYTAYGESKAEGEKIVRGECTRCWTILRPTNIWGPWHPFFPGELWRYLRKRYYIHPGYRPINKYYGYIDNAVEQIVAIGLMEPPEPVSRKVFYVTDPPIDNARWMDGFSNLLSGKPARRAPIPLWRVLAVTGDLLHRLGVSFPVSSPRLFRLTVDEALPHESTFAIAGSPAVPLEEGIRRCVDWYRSRPEYSQ